MSLETSPPDTNFQTEESSPLVSFEFLVNVFDENGVRIEQKRFKTFQEANSFMIEEDQKGRDTHLSRLQILTE